MKLKRLCEAAMVARAQVEGFFATDVAMSNSGVFLDARARTASVAVCIGLIVLTWIVFGQTVHHQFINYDDNTYVYENSEVAAGISLHGIAWAFTHVYSSNWHPLTTISHMLDCQFYRLNAGGHHFTNVLLHTSVAIVLFLALREMTGAVWRSAFVATVFAIHPLRVESVAWIAERKDILSGLFFVLTLFAYVRYARRPSWPLYLGVASLLTMGLLCKPMLVTTPFVLLLVDYWPLQRFRGVSSVRWLLIEKIPLIILSAASCIATLFAQKNAIGSIEELPLWSRVNNALVTCIIYIWQMIWPRHLAPFYPHPDNYLQHWQIALAVLIIASITIGAFICRRKRPYILTGWFWYLGMLVPTIGLVQVGMQAHADRYTYLPHIGLYILASWGVSEAVITAPSQRRILSVVAAIVIVALTSLAWVQTSYWRDSEKLWSYTLTVTKDNDIAHNGLGAIYLENGQVERAVSEFRAALYLRPGSAYHHNNLGAALLKSGRGDEAIDHLKAALQILPNHPTAHYYLGNAYLEKGQPDAAISEYEEELAIRPEHVLARCSLATTLVQKGDIDQAITQYQKTIELRPDYAEAHYDLGSCYLQKKEIDHAIKQYQEALKLSPNLAAAHNNLAVVLWQSEQAEKAIAEWEETLHIQPDNIDAQNNLAWALATSSNPSIRNGAKALKVAERLSRSDAKDNPRNLRTLAAVYAENGRFQEAMDIDQRGIELADAQGNSALAKTIEADLELYRAHTPINASKEASRASKP